jgi:hypothetical protein
MLSFDLQNTKLVRATEDASGDVALSVTLEGRPLGAQEHGELFALRAVNREEFQELLLKYWEPQIAGLELSEVRCVYILFLGTIFDGNAARDICRDAYQDRTGWRMAREHVKSLNARPKGPVPLVLRA